MKYKTIPDTELMPSALCFGGGVLSVENQREYCFDMLDRYLYAGGNFIDTANIYGKWLPSSQNESERSIGQWMKQRKNRSRVIIGTKGAHPHLSSMHVPRLSRGEVTADLHESLAALGTDCVDLYWLHRDDESRPVSEILGYLNDFVREGKIRYFGCSNWKPARIAEAMRTAEREGLRCFAGNQMLWSLAAPNRDAIADQTLVCMDEDGMSLHRKTGLAAIPYSSQANGFFNKLDRRDAVPMPENLLKMYGSDENNKRYERIKALAAETDKTVTEIVLLYLVSQPFTTIPIIGSRTAEQLSDSLKAGEGALGEEELRFLEGK